MRGVAERIGIAAVWLAIVVWLAGGVRNAAVFLLFFAFLFVPAVLLLSRVTGDVLLAVVATIVLFVPYFLLRKFIGLPLDIIAALALWSAAAMPPLSIAAAWPPHSITIPLSFAAVWTGYAVHAGSETRYYGLFAIDFGILASSVASLRASPLLPESFVAGGGRLVYHWLYFAFPATVQIPAVNALELTNLIVACLLFYAVTRLTGSRLAAAIALFAPFSFYYLQVAAARLGLSMPERNSLLLSPLNSMLAFGNNTFALVLVCVAMLYLERWNRGGAKRDAAIACAALVLVPGYSITLVFPLALWLLILFVIGDIRRRVTALLIAAAAGVAGFALLLALGVIGGASAGRHLGIAFDGGAYALMIVFGMLPLWVIAAMGVSRRTRIPAILALCCAVVPMLLYLPGSPTGMVDMSMKIASLTAIAAAPLIAAALERRRNALIAAVAILGLLQSAAFLLQYPWYRLRGSSTRVRAIPADYERALLWIRDHTPRSASVVDPEGLHYRDALFTTMVGERRVWLPTPYTDTFLITSGGADLAARKRLWAQGAMAEIAKQADYLVLPRRPDPPGWRLVTCCGSYCVWQSWSAAAMPPRVRRGGMAAALQKPGLQARQQ
jgi:hypothetical protein